jgi:phosphoglycerol transferase MdoB-like AlkP superfamily enzyme
MIVLIIISLYTANLVTYGYWNSPIDKSIFEYTSTPAEMTASISSWKLISLVGMIILVLYVLHFKVYTNWVSRPLKIPGKRSWTAGVIFLLVLPLLFYPIRGGLSTSPIQSGSVYFHQNTFINHVAVNPVWNLIYTFLEGDKLNQSVNFYPDQKVQKIMDTLYNSRTTHESLLNTDRPNIILILLESFAQPVITELGGNGEAAPNFNGLATEGIFFNRIFAAGTMTDRSLGAVMAGYPSIPRTSVLYYENKVQNLPNLNIELKSAGYNSSFLYGGDIDFAHIRSFLVMGKFDKIISDQDFPRSVPSSNWGVPDHVLFQRLMEETDQAQSPFFHVLLTLSSHSPFDVPMKPVFPGSSQMTKYKNSIYYTDQCLGEFVRVAKTKDWWDQTLIILMSDHGCRMRNMTAHDMNRFRIPMLWLGGALSVTDTVITQYGSQTDLPVTLLNQLGLSVENFRFSKDLLSNESNSFAYYTFDVGTGFITDSSYSIYCLVSNKYLLKKPLGSSGETDPGLAYMQYLIKDFNSLSR